MNTWKRKNRETRGVAHKLRSVKLRRVFDQKMSPNASWILIGKHTVCLHISWLSFIFNLRYCVYWFQFNKIYRTTSKSLHHEFDCNFGLFSVFSRCPFDVCDVDCPDFWEEDIKYRRHRRHGFSGLEKTFRSRYTHSKNVQIFVLGNVKDRLLIFAVYYRITMNRLK